MKSGRRYSALVVNDPDGRAVELVYGPSGQALADAVRAVGGDGDFLHAERRCVAVGVAHEYARDHPAVQLDVSAAPERRARAAAQAASNARSLSVAAAVLACAWRLSGVLPAELLLAALVTAWIHGGSVNDADGASSGVSAALWVAAATAALWGDRASALLPGVVRLALKISYPHCCDAVQGCTSGCTCGSGATLDGRLCDVATCADLPVTLGHAVCFTGACGAYAAASDRGWPTVVPWTAAVAAGAAMKSFAAFAAPIIHTACLTCWERS